MKKFVAFSFGALMALSFNACSDDDVANTTPVDNTSLGYFHVNIITNEDATSRSNSLDDAIIEQGSESEHKVNEIMFYFFDGKKKYISESEVTTATFSNETESNESTGNGNIESKSSEIVVVPNYDPENEPTYMITVLNPTKKVELSAGQSTIDDFYKLASPAFNTTSNVYTKKTTDENYFVMSTSTYKHDGEDACNKMNYVTHLDKAVFYPTMKKAEEETDKSKYTTVYVERLAAKVNADFSETNIKSKWTKYGEGVFRLGDFKLNKAETKTTLYAKVLGWGLNATAKLNYISKHIDESWADNLLGDNLWNDPNRRRSYWGESYYYENDGSYDFPEKYQNLENQAATDYWKVGTESYYKGYALNYISAKEMKGHEMGNALYCGENTNSSDCVSKSHIPGTVTCVLMLAQLQKDVNGTLKTAGDIVKYKGIYYDADALAAKFLNGVASSDYKYLTEAADQALELTANNLAYTKDSDLNGRVRIQLDSDFAKTITKWVDKDGNELKNAKGNAFTAADFNDLLDDEQNEYPMVMYRDGLMYYYTPIYHLTTNDVESDGIIPEGYYGVVRNHMYSVTITGFRKSSDDKPYDPSNPDGKDPEGGDPTDPGYGPEGPGDGKDPIDPGHGVDDEDEPIVPTKEDEINYYLGTNIHVLSWRQVSQSVKF
jgi:hypothetical protein